MLFHRSANRQIVGRPSTVACEAIVGMVRYNERLSLLRARVEHEFGRHFLRSFGVASNRGNHETPDDEHLGAMITTAFVFLEMEHQYRHGNGGRYEAFDFDTADEKTFMAENHRRRWGNKFVAAYKNVRNREDGFEDVEGEEDKAEQKPSKRPRRATRKGAPRPPQPLPQWEARELAAVTTADKLRRRMMRFLM
jgi:hypothetical protein